jgi:nicotinamide mononucleotide transporter
MGSLEITAVVLGLIHVSLLIKEKIWAWPAGIATVTIYVYIFFQEKLYSDAILHVIYIGLNVYGWWNWSRPNTTENQLPVTTLSKKMIGFWTFFVLVAFLAWGFLMDVNTDADFPYPDAFTTVASLVAQYLLAKKKLDNWIIWIIVDIVALNIYWIKGLQFTSGLYLFYLFLSILGFIEWRKNLKLAKQ